MFEEYNKVQKAILETTLKLISEKELQATSMSLISKESGISTGSIYNCFPSKEAIINELYMALVKFHGEVVLKDFYINETIKVRFWKTWENFIKFSMKYPKAYQFVEQYSFSPYIDEEAKKEVSERSWCGPLAKLYKEAIDENLFIELDPKLMVQMHYGSMVYLLKSYFQNIIDITEEVINKVITYCWNSVIKEKNSL